MLTFDDGIIKIFGQINISKPGEKPKIELQEKSKHYFSFETVGIQRFYTALSAKVRIDNVVKIWEDRSIITEDIAELEDGLKYRIIQVQHLIEEGMGVTKLSLERIK